MFIKTNNVCEFFFSYSLFFYHRTVGSPFLSEMSTVPYRTVPYRTVPYRTLAQQTVYRFKNSAKLTKNAIFYQNVWRFLR